MTRKEEIEQAAHNYALYFPKDYVKENDYIAGAEWADENMKNKLIAELTKLRDNAIEEMRKDKTTSTPEYYSACGQAHAYVQIMNIVLCDLHKGWNY